MTILDKYLELIQSLINNNESSKACIEFSKLIKSLEQNNDKNLPQLYYEYALVLFDNGLFDECLIMLNNAYKNNYMKNEIKEIIYNCFITPNLNEFKTAYNTNYNIYNSKDKYPRLSEIDYENLSLDFIPIGKDKYYIFDNKSDVFSGIIDLNEEKLKNNFTFEFEDEFSDILIVDDGNLNNISLFLNSNRIIYYISPSPSKALSFFKLPNIMAQYLPNVIIFESLEKFHYFFRSNTSIYLPKLLYTGSNHIAANLSKEVQLAIDEEHNFRISLEGRNDNNILLSICFPTWNRGHRALDGVLSLLNSNYDSEIEIIVSDNNSDKYLDDYKKIKNLPDSRIKYFKAESNTGFLGNFCKVLELSKGKFCLILSDEDKVNLKTLHHYMSLLSNNPNLALIRSSTSKSYIHLTNKYTSTGEDSFLNVFLSYNYMPGIIYNSEVVHTHCLTRFIIDNQHNLSCFGYPHMWLDSLISFYGDCCTDATILCLEGEDERQSQIYSQDNIIYELDSSSEDAGTFIPFIPDLDNLPTFYSYQNRLEQHISWIDLINKLLINNPRLFILAYTSLCFKTNFLVSLVKDNYINAGYDWNKIYDEIYDCCIKGIDKLNISIDKEVLLQMINFIKEENQKYRI